MKAFTILLSVGAMMALSACSKDSLPTVPAIVTGRSLNTTDFPYDPNVVPVGKVGEFSGNYSGKCELEYQGAQAQSCEINLVINQGEGKFQIDSSAVVNLGGQYYTIELNSKEHLILGNDLISSDNQVDSGDIGSSSFWIMMDDDSRLQFESLQEGSYITVEALDQGDYLKITSGLTKGN
ncbi:MAG: hypothetical protein KC478_15675 [Bacteriovoracaceae bacterium]|nr:hypothetical protein [Bacteriovoracaceae bacterium]